MHAWTARVQVANPIVTGAGLLAGLIGSDEELPGAAEPAMPCHAMRQAWSRAFKDAYGSCTAAVIMQQPSGLHVSVLVGETLPASLPACIMQAMRPRRSTTWCLVLTACGPRRRRPVTRLTRRTSRYAAPLMCITL